MIRALALTTLLLAPPVGEEDHSLSTPVLALWITGGVGVGVGVGFGIKALVHQSRATDIDYLGGQREIDKTRRSQLIANIGYGVGLASLAAGLVLQQLFGDLGATVVPAPGAVGMVVRF